MIFFAWLHGITCGFLVGLLLSYFFATILRNRP